MSRSFVAVASLDRRADSRSFNLSLPVGPALLQLSRGDRRLALGRGFDCYPLCHINALRNDRDSRNVWTGTASSAGQIVDEIDRHGLPDQGRGSGSSQAGPIIEVGVE